MGIPELLPVVEEAKGSSATDAKFDAVVIVTSDIAEVTHSSFPFTTHFGRVIKVDENASSSTTFLAVEPSEASGGRVVIAPTGPLNRDYDDVRRFADAASSAITRAKSAGSRRPLLYILGVPDSMPDYARALEVSLLSALASLYEPLQAREAGDENELEPIKAIGFVVNNLEHGKTVARVVTAIEQGRRVTRDIGSGDPERMAAPNAAQYILAAFKGEANVEIHVEDSREVLEREYPLVAAVGRCSFGVKRHWPNITRLVYTGPGEITETLLFAGKGITYDTGGADIKAGGHMAGMHMDKGGAAAVAGFLKTCAVLQPKGIFVGYKLHMIPAYLLNAKVIAELAFVRNSSGSDNYVSDEIIRSHAGKRVMVGNTDAEGRMVLADCLSHLREAALKEKNPRIMTCATLTGHASRAMGTYSITIDNGPALQLELSTKLQAAGAQWGDNFEISRLRKEDYDFVGPKNSAFDVLQCNTLPSSATARGHQFPAAFLVIASGLVQHGRDSSHPLPFSHIDIAGSAAEGDDYQFGRPTATPVVAWTARYVLDKLK